MPCGASASSRMPPTSVTADAPFAPGGEPSWSTGPTGGCAASAWSPRSAQPYAERGGDRGLAHGSTAVPGLLAKDVIDVQVGVRHLADADRDDVQAAMA